MLPSPDALYGVTVIGPVVMALMMPVALTKAVVMTDLPDIFTLARRCLPGGY